MLILTRRIGETILVGDNITIKVLAMNGGQTKIGIEAPRAIPVLRSELAGQPKPGPNPPVA